MCVDEKFGRAQRQGLGAFAQRLEPEMAGNLGGEQNLPCFGGCDGNVVGCPARIDSPGDRGVDQFVQAVITPRSCPASPIRAMPRWSASSAL